MTKATMTEFDVAVIGTGSGGELVATLLAKGSVARPPMRVVVFENELVGGECPFVACIPSKVLLARSRQPCPDWSSAVARRDQVTEGRDDAGHVRELLAAGVTVVRGVASVAAPGLVRADATDYRARHIVVATGARAKVLTEIACPDDVWMSSDALSSEELPTSLVIIGGGPIGCELSEVYARFGTSVTVVEMADTLLSDVEPEISAAMRDHLVHLGVTVLLSATLSAITKADKGGYVVHVAGREPITTARVLVGIGKTPRLDGIGLEALGLDPANVAVDDSGRLGGLDRVWAVGDVTGIAPYTHGASAQAAVVAHNIAGGARSMRAAVMPRCVYTHPPVAAVGPTLSDASLAMDIVSVRVSYGDIARPATDELGDGVLIMFANRADGSVIGASGMGQSMDELVSLVTLAVETQWPVSRLQHIVQPFPTLSQLVGHAFKLLAEKVDVANADQLHSEHRSDRVDV